MSKGIKISLIIIGIFIVVGLIAGSSYNNFMVAKENVKSKYGDISVQLERRANLIPNLVSAVKGYTSHEEKIINSITAARANLIKAGNAEEKATANQELTTALGKLMVIVENYPNLKANENFIQLQDELAGTENRIAVSRKDYNEAVKSYNTSIKKFPTNMMAGMFGFDEEKYFEAKAGTDETPVVEFE